ncbi:MAG: DUF4157 domain-containing protein [Anaerolineaceae bacterium]|nr:DUF4157 domain-containing protein [Anaerolineaceae bacterium]
MREMIQTAKNTPAPTRAIQAQSVVYNVLRSPGKPLAAGVRSSMEPQFGYDFSKVRIHADGKAAESAEAVNALAYTVGHDVVFAAEQYAPHTSQGKRLLAHELTHVVQQSGVMPGLQPQLKVQPSNHNAEQQADRVANQVLRGIPVSTISPQTPGLMRRKKFTPWPGQKGKDVSGTRQKRGTVISERVQRTDSDKYEDPKPILLSFDSSTCTVTSTMEIHFKHPNDAKKRLPTEKFNKLKTRILSVANKRLNGWMKISVANNADCSVCKGKTITIKVIAKEGRTAHASVVYLQSGTGRSSAGRIYAGSTNWFLALLDGVSDSLIWHESGHIVLGLPDEYKHQKGDPPRPASSVNESDWSPMASHPNFGRRAMMHPRHFSFIPAWLKRRFPKCTFTLVAQPIPLVVDVVSGFNIFGTGFGGGGGFGLGFDLAAGFPLDKLRKLRILLGGYTNVISVLTEEQQDAILFGALLGMDYSTNRSAGGFAVRGDVRAGAGMFTRGLGERNKKLMPEVGGTLTLGYQGPRVEIGVVGGIGKLFPGRNKYIDALPENNPIKLNFENIKKNPYYTIGIRLGFSF